MYPFIDSLCLRDGEYELLRLHLQRISATSKKHFQVERNLNPIFETLDQEARDKSGLWKLTLRYDEHHHQIQSVAYSPRSLQRLHLIEDPAIDYAYKYADRSAFDFHLKNLDPEEDILITQHGLLTDASYANVILWDGEAWFTPSTPLLNGVKRQYLLSKKQIIEREIRIEDIPNYFMISLINAMLNPGDVMLSTENIVP